GPKAAGRQPTHQHRMTVDPSDNTPTSNGRHRTTPGEVLSWPDQPSYRAHRATLQAPLESRYTSTTDDRVVTPGSGGLNLAGPRVLRRRLALWTGLPDPDDAAEATTQRIVPWREPLVLLLAQLPLLAAYAWLVHQTSWSGDLYWPLFALVAGQT